MSVFGKAADTVLGTENDGGPEDHLQEPGDVVIAAKPVCKIEQKFKILLADLKSDITDSGVTDPKLTLLYMLAELQLRTHFPQFYHHEGPNGDEETAVLASRLAGCAERAANNANISVTLDTNCAESASSVLGFINMITAITTAGLAEYIVEVLAKLAANSK